MFLGFDAETEKMIGHGSRVDVIWSTRIGNLGAIKYVFEVHKSGSVENLIINLLKAANNPFVQKVIAVSNVKQLERIKKLIEDLQQPELSKKIVYWNAKEVERLHEILSEANTIIEKLELVKKETS